jgi:hypothetical protein
MAGPAPGHFLLANGLSGPDHPERQATVLGAVEVKTRAKFAAPVS